LLQRDIFYRGGSFSFRRSRVNYIPAVTIISFPLNTPPIAFIAFIRKYTIPKNCTGIVLFIKIRIIIKVIIDTLYIWFFTNRYPPA